MNIGQILLKAKRIIEDVNAGRLVLDQEGENPTKYLSKYIVSPYYYGNPTVRSHNKVIVKWIQENLSKKDKILEVGCGLGTLGLWLHELGYTNYTGIEINSHLVTISKMISDTLDVRFMDGTKMTFNDNSYDFVGCVNSIFGMSYVQLIKESIRVSRSYVEMDGLDAEWLLANEPDDPLRGYTSLPTKSDIITAIKKGVKKYDIILDTKPRKDRSLLIIKVTKPKKRKKPVKKTKPTVDIEVSPITKPEEEVST